MSQFTKILVVSPYADGRTWYLREEFGYDVGAEGGAESIVVPVQFTTDFASVPRIFWVFLPRWGKYGNAAVIHDWLYYDKKIAGNPIERKRADDVFLEAMGVLNVVDWQKTALYYGVRWFGWLAWYLVDRRVRAGFSKIAKAAPAKSTDLPTHWRIGPNDWIKVFFET